MTNTIRFISRGRRAARWSRTVSVGVVLLSAFSAVPASAHVERICGVSYETQTGWSSEEVRKIDFKTGYEVREVWPGVNPAEVYVLIWFSEHEVALVHLPTPQIIGTRSELGTADFVQLFSRAEAITGDQFNVPSGRSRRWRIRAKSGPHEFIDPDQSDWLTR